MRIFEMSLRNYINVLHIQFYQCRFQITVPPDGRYVAPAGRLHAPRVVDTTYLIREPVTLSLKPYFLNNKYPVIPSDSLRIYRYFKYGKSQEGNGCNLSPNDLPSKVRISLFLCMFIEKSKSTQKILLLRCIFLNLSIKARKIA